MNMSTPLRGLLIEGGGSPMPDPGCLERASLTKPHHSSVGFQGCINFNVGAAATGRVDRAASYEDSCCYSVNLPVLCYRISMLYAERDIALTRERHTANMSYEIYSGPFFPIYHAA